ncbi:MAG: hypothetical protein K0U84_20165 [Actinomycetia bacterium]|nr:hypothetical protein [Actinomycetes bacterium]
MPTWQRLTVLASLLLLGWAVLLPPGQPPQWWHYAATGALLLTFLGSWHGQHISTTVRRWAPMARYNRHRRTRGPEPARSHQDRSTGARSAETDTALEAKIVIHLRPRPHALTTPEDTADQLPWKFITGWLHRYGVRADELAITSATRTPPASGLRADSAALLSGRTPQHRDTWLTYTLRAHSNVAALTARQTTMGQPAADPATDDGVAQRAGLSDTTARRLVAELRERGWLATLTDSKQQLPQFVAPTSAVRQETWTATEHSDGFRAIYAVRPHALAEVLEALPSLGTKSTWVTLIVRPQGHQHALIEACVGTLTSTQPIRHPLPGLDGFHGLHRHVAPALTATGFDRGACVDLPATEIMCTDLEALRWPTTAAGVPIGFTSQRQPVYLGLASPEPVRITVTGTRQFQVGIVSRLALSGLPVAVDTANPGQWAALANHGATQQFSIRPAVVPAGAIVVTDGSRETASGPITVMLRRPQSAPAPATTVVITQDGGHPNLFDITTARGRQRLSTRLADIARR